jgi:hypothetical protein
MVGVLVMAIIGGVISASVFIVIPWAQDAAARASLDAVKIAQSVSHVKDGKFSDWAGLLDQKLVTGTPTNVDSIVNADGTCYVNAALSGSGTAFYQTSRSNTILDDVAGPPDTSWCVNSTQALAEPVINTFTNPSFESVTSGSTVTRKNFALDPRATANTNVVPGATLWTPRWFGKNAAGVSTAVTGAVDGPATGLDTYLRKTWTVAGESGDTAWALSSVSPSSTPNTGSMPVLGGAPYTVSAYLRSTAAGKKVAVRVNWRDVDGVYISTPNSSYTTLTPNWQRVSATQIAPANAALAEILLFTPSGMSGWEAGDTLDGTGALIEQTDQLRAYFDGSTADALGVDNGWSGAANNSVSTVKTSTVTVRSNLIPNPSAEVNLSAWTAKGAPHTVTRSTEQAYAGQASVKVVATSTSVNGVGITFTGLTIGATYTGSGYVWVRPGQAARVVATFTSVGYGTSSSSTGVWQRVTESFTATATTHQWGFDFRDAPAVNDYFYIDAAAVEATTAVNPYFDGSTSNASDFTYSWSGAAHASASIQSGVKVDGLSGNHSGRVAWQSSAWSVDGSKSLAVAGGQPSADSFGQFEYASIPGALANRTFTVTATLRTEEALPTNADHRAWSYYLVYHLTDGSYITKIFRPTSTTAGTHKIQETFTFPSDATTLAFARLYNGSPNSVPVYWDSAMLIEGTYTDSYFDGDSVNGTWNGVPHKSMSTGYIRW